METDNVLMWHRHWIWLWLVVVITVIAITSKIILFPHHETTARSTPTVIASPIPWADVTIQGLSYGTGLSKLESILGPPDEIGNGVGNTRIIYSFHRKKVRLELSASSNNQVNPPFGILTGHQMEYRGQIFAVAYENRKSDIIRLLGKPRESQISRYIYNRMKSEDGHKQFSNEERAKQRNDNLWVDFDDRFDADQDPKVVGFTLFWMKLSP